MSKSIPTGRFARGSVAATTAAVVGAKKLTFITRKPFLSEKNLSEAQRAHDDDVAATIFNSLAKLRGTALKAGQILSLEAGLLPESYRRQLFKAHYQAPPLNRAVIRKLMSSEFGRQPNEVFAEFSDEAFAAASLGQVHRGVLHEGGEVAVKIQYPGVGGTISGDLQLVRQIVAPFFKSPFVTRFLGEIEERLREETDYHREFANTEWFRENLGMPGILIPKAHPKYSTGAVLTTDLLTGLSFDRFLETNPSQEMKNRFGQTLYDLFMNCLFRLNRMHADPNPGNYLFREDGRVGLIDFGCVKVLEPEFCKTMSELWRAHLRRDIEAERRIYKVFGVNQSEDEWERVYEKMLKPFGEWLSLPMQNEVFDFGKHPDYCDRAGKFMGYVINDPAFSKFTTNTIFVDRTIYGLFRIFGQLGAQIRFHNEWVY